MYLCHIIAIVLDFSFIMLILSSSYSQELRSFRYSYSTLITYFVFSYRKAIVFQRAILLHALFSIAIPSVITFICASSSSLIECSFRPALMSISFD